MDGSGHHVPSPLASQLLVSIQTAPLTPPQGWGHAGDKCHLCSAVLCPWHKQRRAPSGSEDHGPAPVTGMLSGLEETMDVSSKSRLGIPQVLEYPKELRMKRGQAVLPLLFSCPDK